MSNDPDLAPLGSLFGLPTVNDENLPQKISEQMLQSAFAKLANAKPMSRGQEFRQSILPYYERDNAKADFDFWSKATYWTLEEATALSLGKEPKIINSHRLKQYTDAFADKYRQLRDLAKRAYIFKKLYDPILPSLYISWCKESDIAFPPELEALIIKRGNFVINWPDHHKKLEVEFAKTKEKLLSLDKLNSENVTIAHERFAEYEAKIVALETQLQEKLTEVQLPQETMRKEAPDYISPYMELMQQAVIANDIAPTRQSKKDVLKQWFLDNATPNLVMSDKKADMMATLIRLPESGTGGNKKSQR